MTEQDDQIDNIFNEMQIFLKSQARKEIPPSHPLFLKTEYKTSFKVTDSAKNVFQVEEAYLSAFREIYTDKVFKVIRLHDWAFELQFLGKRCQKISLLSETVVFTGGIVNKKEITGCHFKIDIIEGEAEIKKLSPELNGYLNRIGKRNFIEQSTNVAKEMKSLISFAAWKPIQTTKFAYNPWTRGSSEYIDPMSTITPEGKKVLEKVRNFITRSQIYQFIVEQQVSREAAAGLRKLINPQKEKRS